MKKLFSSIMLFLIVSNLNSQISGGGSSCDLSLSWCPEFEDPIDNSLFNEWINIFGGCQDGEPPLSECGNIEISYEYDISEWIQVDSCNRQLEVMWMAEDDCGSPPIFASSVFELSDGLKPFWISSTSEILPSYVTVFLDDCSGGVGYTFEQNSFKDQITGKQWEFPLIENVHFADDCDASPKFYCNKAPSELFEIGITQVEYNITDACGNNESHTFYVHVICKNSHDQVCNNKFIANDGMNDDRFGFSVDMCGSRTVVGSPQNNSNGLNTGSVYIYEYDGTIWNETKIVGSDSDSDDNFGLSIATDGNFVAVGAPRDNNTEIDVGAVYVFEFDGMNWNEAKIIPSDGKEGDFFGSSIDIQGNRLVVASNSKEGLAAGPGAIYIYEYSGAIWQETKLIASDHFDGNFFGSSVSVYNDIILVGASRANGLVNSSGAVYLYERILNRWDETKIIASDGDNIQDDFGVSVCIYKDKFLVGCSRDNIYDTHSGSAYLFEKNGNNWEESKIVPPTGRSSDHFGEDVAINDNFMVISVPGYDDISNKFGAVYLFENVDTILKSTRFLMPEDTLFKGYGSTVALSDSLFLVGASQDNDNGNNSGASFLYAPKKYHLDNDNDNFGTIDSTIIAWELNSGWSTNDLDCDDGDSSINPDAMEISGNGIDEDCDGMDGSTSTHQLNGHQVNIFPNPVLDNLFIDTELRGLNYRLYNNAGKVILDGSLEVQPIYTGNLKPGFYLLVIESVTVGRIIEKIIKG